MLGTTLAAIAGGIAQPWSDAAEPPLVTDVSDATAAAAESKPEKESRWFARIGALGAFYNSSAKIATNGNVIEGSSAHVTDSKTVIFDVGYDLSNQFAVMFMGGIPPTADVIGRGTVSPFGKLGSVRFGPTILSGVYRFPEWHGFRPYAGGGAAHLFILKDHDGSVTKLKVHDNNGFVLQAGLEYRLSRKWELFADYKHVWLNVRAEGFLAGAPVQARVTLNPDLVSAGVKFYFGSNR